MDLHPDLWTAASVEEFCKAHDVALKVKGVNGRVSLFDVHMRAKRRCKQLHKDAWSTASRALDGRPPTACRLPAYLSFYAHDTCLKACRGGWGCQVAGVRKSRNSKIRFKSKNQRPCLPTRVPAGPGSSIKKFLAPNLEHGSVMLSPAGVNCFCVLAAAQ
jgi:hypothetical protein